MKRALSFVLGLLVLLTGFASAELIDFTVSENENMLVMLRLTGQFNYGFDVTS